MTVEVTTPGAHVRKNDSLWTRVLPEIADWLRVNHLASAKDAEQQFSINAQVLAEKLDQYYPGEFKFMERRRLRGIANKRVAKNPRRPQALTGDLKTEFEKVLESLGRIEVLLNARD